MALTTISKHDQGWASIAVDALNSTGCAVVTDVVPRPLLEQTRGALYRLREDVQRKISPERLRDAGEVGTLRLPFTSDVVFYEFLALPEVLEIVDRTIGDTAIMHLMNGFILPSSAPNETPSIFQNSFHRDFPRYLNGYLASVNTFFAIDTFTAENGATIVVPGTHQRSDVPDRHFLDSMAVAVEAPAGAMLVFDSTLWHAAGRNTSGKDRLALNVQFTRSYIKQQFDYVRALGEEAILRLPDRTQQLLGWYTRVVTSLDEYYRPEHERLYRKDQG